MALKSNQTLSDLKSIDAQIGRLEWIGIRTDRRKPLQTPDQARFIQDYGIEGDHRATKSGSKRQVTLVQFEYLEVIAKLLNQTSIDPKLLRRNCLVSGINLNSLKMACFSIGEVVLQGTGFCHPCSRMEENFGSGGYNAVRGHGGITATIVNGGIASIGDAVQRRQT